MCGSRKASGWSCGGSCGELCKNSFPCENPALLESGGEKKYHKSLSGNYQDLWETFLYAFCHLCIPGFCPGLETDARVRERV